MTIQEIVLVSVLGAAACLTALSPTASAGLDTSGSIICAITDAFDCDSDEGCTLTKTENIGLPVFFKLDLPSREITAAGARETGDKRETAIKGVTDTDGKLFLQGVERRGWSLVVDKETGQMTLAASSGDEAIVLFGRCTAP